MNPGASSEWPVSEVLDRNFRARRTTHLAFFFFFFQLRTVPWGFPCVTAGLVPGGRYHMCSLAAECRATEGIHMLRISVVSKGRHREEHTEIGIAILGGCTDWKDQIFHITSSNQGSLNTLRIQRLESKFCHYLEKCPLKSSESFVGGERCWQLTLLPGH